MKILNILIAVVAISFLAIPALAESGTLEIQAATANSYTITPQFSTVAYDFNSFAFDSSDYNTLQNINYVGSFTSSLQADTTTFTVSSGGAGSGTVYYVTQDSKIHWDFTGTTITSTSFTLSYAKNIFGVLSIDNGYRDETSTSSTQPVHIKTVTGKKVAGQYITNTQKEFSNNYHVTYPLPGIFTVSIDKSMSTINSKIHIMNVSADIPYYFNETTFNSVDFNFTGNYYKGIRINMSDSSGNRDSVVVNYTGSGVTPPATPVPPVPGAGGSQNGQVSYDYTSATLGTYYGVNVSISDANFSSLFTTYRLKIYDTSGLQVEGSPIEFSTQRYNTTRLWKFAFPGLYAANLSSCAIWECLIGFETQMDSASLLVTEQAYAYNVSTDQTTYTNGDVINISVRNPSSNVIYLGMFLQVGGQTGIMDYPIPGNTNLSILHPVGSDMTSGNWEVALYTSLGARGKVANYVFSIGMPSVTEDKLGLRWGDQYFFGRSNALYYKSNFNVSIVNVYKVYPGQSKTSLFDTFNVSGNISSQKSYLMDATGTWNASITDSGNSSNVTHANMTVLGTPYNDCKTDTPSYICFDNRSYISGDKFIINLRISNPPIIVLNDYSWVIFDSNNKIVFNGTIIKATECCVNINFPYGLTVTKQWKPTSSGKYHLVLYYGGNPINFYSDGTVLADDFALVTTPPVGTTTNLPGTGVSSINAWSANILSLLSSMFFWGLMLLLGFAITVYSGRFPIKTRPELAVMGFAFLETIGGLFAPYTIPIFVVLVIILALMFRKGPELIGQE